MITPEQQEAAREPLTMASAETALEMLYQLHAPHLDQFLHPARVVLERVLTHFEQQASSETPAEIVMRVLEEYSATQSVGMDWHSHKAMAEMMVSALAERKPKETTNGD